MSIRPDQLSGTQPPGKVCHMARLMQTGVFTLIQWEEPRVRAACVPAVLDGFDF